MMQALASPPPWAWLFPALAVTVWIAVPSYAAYARGRLYAAFAGVLLTFALPGAFVLHTRLRALATGGGAPFVDLLFALAMVAAGLQLAQPPDGPVEGVAHLVIPAPGSRG